MEFHEKLQELRKRKGLTQEELGEILFVSRTAISKWESGRGYPSIGSLKAISKYFAVSIDELLSSQEVLTMAQADQADRDHSRRDLVFGLLDCGMALLWFLPFFGQAAGDTVQAVSLLALSAISPFLKAAYCLVVSGMVLWGLLALALQNYRRKPWDRVKVWGSLGWNVLAVLLFILSRQPYGAVFTLIFLISKALILAKQR